MCKAIEMLEPKVPKPSIEEHFNKLHDSIEPNRDKAWALEGLCRAMAEKTDDFTYWGLGAFFEDLANDFNSLMDELKILANRVKKEASETDTASTDSEAPDE